MPLPALIAGWLREQAGADEVRVWMVPPALPTADCEAYGGRLAAELTSDEPVGLLVIGDGSHRHGERAVGRPDDRAAGFDEEVRRALAAADPKALLALDAGLAASLGAIGRAPWQILSGVVGKDGRAWRCAHSRLLIPFGVAYHLAVWDPVG
jgi:aromatic ring-opening dioxygenase LigB subunit